MLRRWGYRVAYRILQLYWLLASPDQRGVKCLLTDGDRVLLVRHTYGSRAWDLPGGSLKRDELPLSAARREMEEELGQGDADWVSLGAIRGRMHRRHDAIEVFGAEVSRPDLRLDLGELAVAAWFEVDRLPLEVGPYVAPIIAGTRRYTGRPATPTRSSPEAYS